MLVHVRIKPKTFWQALAKQSLSQSELATRLGISSSYMSQVVCGTRCPSPRLRRRILELLNPLTFDDLFIIEDRNDEPGA